MLLLALLSGCQALRTADPERLVPAYTEPASRFVEVADTEVHLVDEGEGPAMLMLHGAASSLHDWDGWARELSRDHRVLRIDLPPFGLTGPLPGGRYDPDVYLELVHEVLDESGVEEVVLVGNSLGGYIAANYAAVHPERVRALVLVSPAGYPQSLPWPLRVPTLPVIGWISQHVTPRWVVARGIRDAYGDPERIEPGTIDRHFDLIRAPGAREGLRQLARTMDELRHEPPDWVDEVQAPALILWGEDDDFSSVELADLWIESLPEARLVTLPGVGHVAMEEVPERSLAVARPFLDDVLDRPGPESTAGHGSTRSPGDSATGAMFARSRCLHDRTPGRYTRMNP